MKTMKIKTRWIAQGRKGVGLKRVGELEKRQKKRFDSNSESKPLFRKVGDHYNNFRLLTTR